jgi:hypothetical protein
MDVQALPDLPPRTVVAAPDHELLVVFEQHGFRLNAVLYEMLNEHHIHRTERRGAGYTQATRHLAVHVNNPRRPNEFDEVRLFAERETVRVRALVEGAAQAGLTLNWRSLDLREVPAVLLGNPSLSALYEDEASQQRRLRSLPSVLRREESRLLAQLILDLVLPVSAQELRMTELRPWPEALAIGTCPLAEKYFLEIADSFVRRGGQINVIVSPEGAPLLVEKLNLGDNHSCISLVPLVLNGVRLPAGSLLGVAYDASLRGRPNRSLPGQQIPVAECGFRFLRLTTLAVSPENRRRAFTEHFEAQVRGGLFSPGLVTIDQIAQVAKTQVSAHGGSPGDTP